MTDEQLEELGIFPVYNYANRYNVLQINEDITILSTYTPADVIEVVYQQGFLNGVEAGKSEKILEIKQVLEIEAGENQ